MPEWAVVALATLVALWVDRRWGEPRAAWHPVVWMGHYLDRLGPWVAPIPSPGGRSSPRLLPFARGALVWCLGALAVGLVAWAVQRAVVAGPVWAQALVLGLLLKPLLAWRMLRDEVAAVERALGVSLPTGRERLSWLCSRDVSELSPAQVRETAIETLAENLNDSVVAPLFWFACAGLPGAALYRFANTADAMWGYRGERQGRDWTWAGKWAARLDDALSWPPARLTGLLLMVGQPLAAWRAWGAQARRTPSPNGGWPMAAMALALGVRLGKPGAYVLNPAGSEPQGGHLAQALGRAKRVVVACAVTAALACVVAVASGGGIGW